METCCGDSAAAAARHPSVVCSAVWANIETDLFPRSDPNPPRSHVCLFRFRSASDLSGFCMRILQKSTRAARDFVATDPRGLTIAAAGEEGKGSARKKKPSIRCADWLVQTSAAAAVPARVYNSQWRRSKKRTSKDRATDDRAARARFAWQGRTNRAASFALFAWASTISSAAR